VDADADVTLGAAVTVTVGDDDPHPARHPPAMAMVPAMAATRRQETVAFMFFSISDVASLTRPVDIPQAVDLKAGNWRDRGAFIEDLPAGRVEVAWRAGDADRGSELPMQPTAVYCRRCFP
jgi:hypothetical protein